MNQFDKSLTYEIERLFAKRFGESPEQIETLPASGGDRRYFRLKSLNYNCLAAFNEEGLENRTFAGLAEVFLRHGVHVPVIFDHNENFDILLLEDLGDDVLFNFIKQREEGEVEKLLVKTIGNLVRMQTVPKAEWKDIVSSKPFGNRLIMWDLNYFKYEFVKLGNYLFDEEALEDDFENLSADLMAAAKTQFGFMMRDCQSRNVLIKDDNTYLIDFQGGREGPGVYDIVSLLWQAKAGFSDVLRNKMLAEYARLMNETIGCDETKLLASAKLMALFRMLQVLGAYGFRGLVQKRAHFIESIPKALENLRDLINKGVIDAYPELKRVCIQACDDARFKPEKDEGLIVKVFSFSYKRGYPEDMSGNGGGFMFDCRGMHNPGRYEEYKQLTGMDRPVIDFLESRGEVQEFVRKAFDIVSPSVETYQRRGFTSLQVGFGCTGGQHRSVYCAERMARLLKESYPDADVRLVHRERDISRQL